MLTAQEDGQEAKSDSELLDRAANLGRVLFTRDKDFLREGTRRQQEKQSFGGVIYAHQLRASIAQCIGDLELLAKACDEQEMANRVTYLPLR